MPQACTPPGVSPINPIGSPTRPWTRRKVEAVLADAGIQLDGGRPWDIQVHDDRLFGRILIDGMVGLGDAYIDEWWDCPALDAFFTRALRADMQTRLPFDRFALWEWLKHRLLNLQTHRRARANVERHYDLGNDLFAAMLGPRMLYTCAYWDRARSLDEAQEAKLDLVCRKINLQPGQRILDMGCGWGGFARYAAEKYQARVVGVTISNEQVKWARQACAGLPVEIRLQDYRDVDERFDHVVSIGLAEHVGPKNHRLFFQTIDRCLADDGLCLVHTFATRNSLPNTTDVEVSWINRHIFPGLVAPSLKQLGAGLDGLFVIEDLHNIGAHYDPTLMAWCNNFERNWPTLAEKYGQRFYRMWRYYLLACAGAFRARKYQLWQMVLSKKGVPGGYLGVR